MAIKLPKTYPGTVSVRFLPDINSVHLSWLSFADSKQVRTSLTELPEYFAENKCFGWIADTQNCTAPLSQADQDWIEQVCVHTIKNAGCKVLLSLLPNNMAVRVGNQRWEKQVADVGMLMEQYNSLDECIERIRFVKNELEKKG